MPFQASRFDPEGRGRSLPLCAPGYSKWSVPTWCRTAAPLGRPFKSTSCWSPDVPACAVADGERGCDWRNRPLSHEWGGDPLLSKELASTATSEPVPAKVIETPMVLPVASQSTPKFKKAAASRRTPPSPPTRMGKSLKNKKESEASSGGLLKSGSYFKNTYLGSESISLSDNKLRERLLKESQPQKEGPVHVSVDCSDTFSSELGGLRDQHFKSSVGGLTDIAMESSIVMDDHLSLTPGIFPDDLSKRLLEHAKPSSKKKSSHHLSVDVGDQSQDILASDLSKRLLQHAQPGIPIGQSPEGVDTNILSQVSVAPDGSFHLVTKAPLTPIIPLSGYRSRSSTCVSNAPTELLLPVPDTPQHARKVTSSGTVRISPAPTPRSGLLPTKSPVGFDTPLATAAHAPFSTDLGWRENTAVGKVEIADVQSHGVPTARPTPATPYL